MLGFRSGTAFFLSVFLRLDLVRTACLPGFGALPGRCAVRLLALLTRKLLPSLLVDSIRIEHFQLAQPPQAPANCRHSS